MARRFARITRRQRMPKGPVSNFTTTSLGGSSPDPAESAEVQTTRFGNFEVLTNAEGGLFLLGGGGFGKTYKARHVYLNQIVALKVINDRLLHDASAKERFLREAQVVHQLRHPRIAHVLDFGEEKHSLYYAMEFCGGGTLEHMVSRLGPVPMPIALSCARQLTEALGCAHSQGFIHRDVKPANVMLTGTDDQDPQLKLVDFGLVKHLQGGGSEATAALTATGQQFFTIQFASPEQLMEEELDPRSDIFALGMTIWFLLKGSAPEAGSMASIVARRLDGRSYEAQLPAELPAAYRAILARLLEKDRTHRFQNTDEVLAALAAAELAPDVAPAGGEVASGGAAEPGAGPEPGLEPAGRRSITELYTVLENLGPMPLGALYRATSNVGDEQVAITMIDDALGADPAQRGGIERNVALLKARPHETIARVYGLEEYQEGLALIQEWHRGVSLHSILKSARFLSYSDALRVLLPIAQGTDWTVQQGLPGIVLAMDEIYLQPGDAEAHPEPEKLLDTPLKAWPSFRVRLLPYVIREDASEDIGRTINTEIVTDPAVAFACLLYHLVAGHTPRAAARLSRSAYVTIGRFTEDSNRLLAACIASEQDLGGCEGILRALNANEGVTFTSWMTGQARVESRLIRGVKMDTGSNRGVLPIAGGGGAKGNAASQGGAAGMRQNSQIGGGGGSLINRPARDLAREAQELRAKKEAEEARLRKQQAEEERARKAAEEAQARKQAEEARAKQQAEEERARKEAADQLLKQKQAEEAQARKQAEEDRVRKAAADQLLRQKQAEEARLKKLADEERAKKEAEAKQLRQQQTEEERARKEAEAALLRQRQAEEARVKKLAEDERARKEAEAERLRQQQTEAERARKEAGEALLRQQQAEEERARKEAADQLLRQKQVEEARLKKQAEEVRLKKQAEEERARKEAADRLLKQKQAEEARAKQQAEEERARKEAADQLLKQKQAEEVRLKKLAEEERARKEAEAKQLRKQQAEEERARKAAADQLLKQKQAEEAQAKKLAGEEQARKEAEAKQLRKQQAEEERARKEAADQRLKQRQAEEAQAKKLALLALKQKAAAEPPRPGPGVVTDRSDEPPQPSGLPPAVWIVVLAASVVLVAGFAVFVLHKSSPTRTDDPRSTAVAMSTPTPANTPAPTATAEPTATPPSQFVFTQGIVPLKATVTVNGKVVTPTPEGARLVVPLAGASIGENVSVSARGYESLSFPITQSATLDTLVKLHRQEGEVSLQYKDGTTDYATAVFKLIRPLPEERAFVHIDPQEPPSLALAPGAKLPLPTGIYQVILLGRPSDPQIQGRVLETGFAVTAQGNVLMIPPSFAGQYPFEFVFKQNVINAKQVKQTVEQTVRRTIVIGPGLQTGYADDTYTKGDPANGTRITDLTLNDKGVLHGFIRFTQRKDNNISCDEQFELSYSDGHFVVISGGWEVQPSKDEIARMVRKQPSLDGYKPHLDQPHSQPVTKE